MNYKIIINIPNETHPTEVLITEEQLAALEPALNQKRMVKINGSYFNTTYIAKIVPDVEKNLLEKPKTIAIDSMSMGTRMEKNKEELEKIREKMNWTNK